MTNKQIDIITNLAIDNGLLFEEATETFLVYNKKFLNRIMGIRNFCHQLFIDCIDNDANEQFVIERLSQLIAGIMDYKKDYAARETVGQQIAYPIMNSFLDKTIESFTEFLQTI